MKIKVCGITTLDQLKALELMGIDYAGIILYEKSKRFPGELSLQEKQAIKDTAINKVGVFVNADYEAISKAVTDLGLETVQLHGDETPELCKQLQNLIKVIKVFRVSGSEDIEAMMVPFESACDYYLFDTQTKEYGGSGEQFDWNILQSAQIKRPFFLSGGIGLNDTEKIKNFHHPNFFAVDVNSRFEIKPGIKDLEQVKLFKEKMNQSSIDKIAKQ